jgi:hypothetical protein
MLKHPTKFIKVIKVKDPDTKATVELELRKDLITGAIIGIDGSFLSGTQLPVYDPYNHHGEELIIEDSE